MYQERTIEEIQRDAALAADKAQTEGIFSLDSDERDYYKYYLATHSHKCNATGKAIEPIHAAIAHLVILNLKWLFVLNGCVYIYNTKNGTYERDQKGKVREKIKSLVDFDLVKDKTITAIYNLIVSDTTLIISDDQINRRPKHWIHFQNGYYDYKTDSYKSHDPEYNEINVIPWDYSPSRYPEYCKKVERGSGLLRKTVCEDLLFTSWLNEAVPDPQDQEMLMQYIGYSMTLETGAQKFMMICGSGGTGKSTLLSVIEAILGESNISNVPLHRLQDRFVSAELYLKQANICADIPVTALSEVDMIKRLTGEDKIITEHKGKDFFSFRSYARLYFSGNEIPLNLSDKSNAFYRRLLILKMDHTPDQIDPDLAEKLKTEIPNIITRALDELCASQGEIYESDHSIELVKSAHKKSDTVEAFINDRCEIAEGAHSQNTTVYLAYSKYCELEGRKPLTRNNFYHQMESKGFPLVRGANKKVYREFKGLRLNTIITLSDNTVAASS